MPQNNHETETKETVNEQKSEQIISLLQHTRIKEKKNTVKLGYFGESSVKTKEHRYETRLGWFPKMH